MTGECPVCGAGAPNFQEALHEDVTMFRCWACTLLWAEVIFPQAEFTIHKNMLDEIVVTTYKSWQN